MRRIETLPHLSVDLEGKRRFGKNQSYAQDNRPV
jgi:hypothetical protein